MVRTINKVELLGRVGTDPEMQCAPRNGHRIPDSIGKNSEEVLGSTDLPQSESLGGKQHAGKAATA